MDYRAYKHLVSVLKKKCPVAFPISVRRIKMRDNGGCHLDKKKFYISISHELSESSAIDVLLHEWAHARAWNHYHDSLDLIDFEKRCHDASWGVAYAEVYQIYEQYYLSDCKYC